jgi:hypothetical protein
MYKSRGSNISDLHANMEFECIRHNVLPSRLNVTAAANHVGEVKRSIQTMKERARTTIHGLHFKRLPKVMTQALVYHAAKGLNRFPAKNGISDTLSPLTIMTGRATPPQLQASRSTARQPWKLYCRSSVSSIVKTFLNHLTHLTASQKREALRALLFSMDSLPGLRQSCSKH